MKGAVYAAMVLSEKEEGVEAVTVRRKTGSPDAQTPPAFQCSAQQPQSSALPLHRRPSRLPRLCFGQAVWWHVFAGRAGPASRQPNNRKLRLSADQGRLFAAFRPTPSLR